MKVYGTRDVVLEQGHNFHLAKRRWKLLSVEVGHNTNSISYNWKIKEMRVKFQLMKS